MTLTEIRDQLRDNATDLRRRGINCCAQQAEQLATRLTEAINRLEEWADNTVTDAFADDDD